MATEDKDLCYLDELAGYKVAEDYPDVIGWDVYDTNRRVVGTVDRLLVSKEAERVVYLVIEVNEDVVAAGHQIYGATVDGVHEFLNKEGESQLIVPIGMVRLDESAHEVQSDQITHETFSKTNRIRKGGYIDRDYEVSVYGTLLPESIGAKPGNDHNFYDRKEFRRS